MAALVAAERAAAVPTFLSPIDYSDAGGDAFEQKVAVSNAGATLVVWTRFDGDNTRIQARSRDAAGNLGPVDTISDAGRDASQPDLAFDSSGNAIAVWTRFDGAKNLTQAAFRPAAGPWQGAVTISPAGQTTDEPHISFDNAGKAIAVWTKYDAGPGGTAVIQAAIRPVSGSFGAPQTLSATGQFTNEPEVAAGPDADSNATVCWSRSDGAKLRIQCSRRRDVTGFLRPKAATPSFVPLVPAFDACAAPNRVHTAPLNYGSCNPAVRSSTVLTAGTPELNGLVANLTGSVKVVVINGDPSTTADEADVNVIVNIADVRNNPANTDYTGQVLLSVPIKITDRRADAEENPTLGTAQTFDLGVPVQCTATGSTSIGSNCTATTSVDSLIPGAVTEQARSIWELGRFVIKDPGPNGTGFGAGCPLTCGDGDEGTFLRQGIFVP